MPIYIGPKIRRRRKAMDWMDCYIVVAGVSFIAAGLAYVWAY